MKRRISAVLGALLLCLLLAPLTAATAWAADADRIINYDVTVEPNVDDGSLLFTVNFDWKVLEELPHGEKLKIGIPNGSIRNRQALTDNIERMSNDNSYMYVYLDRTIKSGETVHFAYSWVQEYMYTLGDDGGVNYDYTPGWFDEIGVNRMTVTWVDPAGVSSDVSKIVSASAKDRWAFTDRGAVGMGLDYGEQISFSVHYADWPTELDPGMSRENAPHSYRNNYYEYSDDSGDGFIAFVVIVMIVAVVLIMIAAARRDGYAGGFGTHYVFVNNLWYPAGPDGKPKPGSTGTAHKPRPPVSHSSGSGGFGGGSRGGGFGGGGFGGGSHCACASSCACACACACAGGGRAGCSAKNLYGAVKLDEEMSRRLAEKTE